MTAKLRGLSRRYQAAVEKLDTVKRTVLDRVTQEALTNVARHAHASRVDVTIRKLPRAVGLSIHDDGKSFLVNRVLDSTRNGRLGLLGMRERVEMVGGTFCVESAPGQGTNVQVEVPFAQVGNNAVKRSGKTTLKCP